MSHSFLVVIPAYNEADTIVDLVERASRHAGVCVVDDASKDGTGDLVASTGKAHLIRHKTNTHIAGALRDGLCYAFEQQYDFCITMDAGLTHDPDVIPQFKERTEADLVLGYREERKNVPIWREGLSWGAKVLMNLAMVPRFVP